MDIALTPAHVNSRALSTLLLADVYMEERVAGESPLMHTFAVPGSEGGQAASCPRSLGPLRDVMDLGSPAWADGR